MRRSSIDKNYLRLFLICLGLVFYHTLSSLYTLLPLFVGVFFSYVIINFDKEKNRLYIYLAFAYLTMYDLDKGFYLFSSLLFLLLFHYVFVDKIKNFFMCNNCIIFIYVSSAYLGHYALNLFISYILNQDRPLFSELYFYYIFLDSIIAMILFKGKV